MTIDPYVVKLDAAFFDHLDRVTRMIHERGFEDLAGVDPQAAFRTFKEWLIHIAGSGQGDKVTVADVRVTKINDGADAVQGAARQLFARHDSDIEPISVEIQINPGLIRKLARGEKVKTIKFDVEPPNLAF